MVTECRLTTIDNPYDPFEDFKNWYLFDITKGYNTSEYLSRVSFTSTQFSSEENNSEIERAIDEIIFVQNQLGNFNYKKVYRNHKEAS